MWHIVQYVKNIILMSLSGHTTWDSLAQHNYLLTDLDNPNVNKPTKKHQKSRLSRKKSQANLPIKALDDGSDVLTQLKLIDNQSPKYSKLY